MIERSTLSRTKLRLKLYCHLIFQLVCLLTLYSLQKRGIILCSLYLLGQLSFLLFSDRTLLCVHHLSLEHDPVCPRHWVSCVLFPSECSGCSSGYQYSRPGLAAPGMQSAGSECSLIAIATFIAIAIPVAER